MSLLLEVVWLDALREAARVEEKRFVRESVVTVIRTLIDSPGLMSKVVALAEADLLQACVR